MKPIPHRKLKFEYLAERQGWICPISKEKWLKGKGKLRRVDNVLHHFLVHDTDSNCRKYPLLVHSLLNLAAVSNEEHLSHGFWGRVSLSKAVSIESFLFRHPKISRWVNNPDHTLYSNGGAVSSGDPPSLQIEKEKLPQVLLHIFKEIIYAAH